MTDSIKARFWAKVDKTDTCWLWTGAKTPDGYGNFWDGTAQVRAHRFSFGTVPPGLVLDHLCRTPACVNPSHLEAVTQRENTLRGVGPTSTNAAKTHCVKGHEFTPENTYIVPGTPGWRHCQTCVKEKRDKSNAERAGATWICTECGREGALAAKARHLRMVHGIVHPKRLAQS